MAISPGSKLAGNEAQDRKARAELEGKLLAALDGEAAEMGKADWDQMRERVRQTATKG